RWWPRTQPHYWKQGVRHGATVQPSCRGSGSRPCASAGTDKRSRDHTLHHGGLFRGEDADPAEEEARSGRPEHEPERQARQGRVGEGEAGRAEESLQI
ncbi:hypothetical protein LTR39_003292, partial [Cryomyces antarcticus]